MRKEPPKTSRWSMKTCIMVSVQLHVFCNYVCIDTFSALKTKGSFLCKLFLSKSSKESFGYEANEIVKKVHGA